MGYPEFMCDGTPVIVKTCPICHDEYHSPGENWTCPECDKECCLSCTTVYHDEPMCLECETGHMQDDAKKEDNG